MVEELTLVDWGTVLVYVCPDSCTPEDGDLTYIQEFSHVQMAEDFENIKYGTNPHKQQN